jgi:O-antigen/teichoic acid export membrane protein
MKHFKELAGQTVVYGLSNIVGRFLNYLLVPIYTRVLLTGEYGTVSEFYGYSSFLAVIFTYGMETSFFRYVQGAENKERTFSTAWLSVILSTAGLSILLFILSPTLASVTRNQGHIEYIWYFIFIVAADAITAIPFAWLRQQGKPKKFASLKLGSIFINISLNLFFLKVIPWMADHGYAGAEWIRSSANGVTYIFISNIASSILILPFFLKEFRLLRNGMDKELWRSMVSYGMPLLVLGLAGMVNETLDRVIMKYLVSDQTYAMQQIGIYAANYKLSIVMTLFIQAFRFAAEPFFFSRSGEHNAKEIYASVMNYFVFVCCLIFLMVTLFIDFFKLFIGESFREGLHIVPILLMANLFLGVYYNLSVWYKVTDKTRYGATITLIGAAITIILNLALIPVMSYEGSAWATLVCYFSIASISYIIGSRHYAIPYDLKKITGSIFLSLVLFVIFRFFHEMQEYHKISYAMLQVIAIAEIIAFCGWVFLLERKTILN